MSFTRFHDDPARIRKQLDESTFAGRYFLNTPGPGISMPFYEDPQLRLQKWGATLTTNTVNLESDLLGVNRNLSRDCLGKDNYLKYNVPNEAISYPRCNQTFTDQSRTTHPAWWYRDLEQVDWYYPPLNPQENTCLSFQNNLSTRILEKDYFTPKRDCLLTQSNHVELPTNGFVGSPITQRTNLCNQNNLCEKVTAKKG
jgi:hypothetical protein